MLRFALEFHSPSGRKGQVGPVRGAALLLTVAALAVVREYRFTRNFITDRTAGASSRISISLAHVFSPIICCWATTTTPSLSDCRTRRGGATTPGETRARPHSCPTGRDRETGRCP